MLAAQQKQDYALAELRGGGGGGLCKVESLKSAEKWQCSSVFNAYLTVSIFKIFRGSMPPDPPRERGLRPRNDRFAITVVEITSHRYLKCPDLNFPKVGKYEVNLLSRTTPRYLYEWTVESCRSQQNTLKVRSSCESAWLARTNIACVFFTFICKPRSTSQLYTFVTAWVSWCFGLTLNHPKEWKKKKCVFMGNEKCLWTS